MTAPVVIAGGRGFIGARLRAALAQRNVPVTVLSRSAAALADARVVAWDDREALDEALAGCTAVVNLCGQGIGDARWSAARKRELLESRTGPAARLAERLQQRGTQVPVYVGASGVGYYGPGTTPVDESAPAGSDFLGQLAVDWEAAHARVPAQRAVVPRIAVVLDAHAGVLARLKWPFRLGVGGPVGFGDQGFPWVHVDDLTAALLHAVDCADLAGPVNVAGPQLVSNADMAAALGRVLRRPALLPLPEVVLRVALGEMHELLTRGQWPQVGRLLGSGFTFRFKSIDSALADLFRRAPA